LNVLPEPRFVPPEIASNQYTVPVLETPPRTTEPVPQREPAVDEVINGESLIVTEVVVA
jgi:hypothetical protein